MTLPLRRVSAVLVDRDGTINVAAPESDYVRDAAQVQLLPGVGAALARLTAAGVLVAVVTNQRGVALGVITDDDVAAVNSRLAELLAAHGARVETWHVCPHDVGACACRKPLDGLVRVALDRLGVPPAEAVIVGDRESDVQAGVRLGLGRILLESPAPASSVAHAVVADLPAAVELVLERVSPA